MYHVRSGRGQDPRELIRARAPMWLQAELEQLTRHPDFSNGRPLSPHAAANASGSGSGGGASMVPIFEYLHEYDDLCVSAMLQWVDSQVGGACMPSSSTLARLHNNVRIAGEALRSPEKLKCIATASDPLTLPPVAAPRSRRGSRAGSPHTSPKSPPAGLSDSIRGLSASSVRASVRGLRPIAVGLLYEKGGRGATIAEDVAATCEHTFGGRVNTADVVSEFKFDTAANVLLIVTAGCFLCDEFSKALVRAIRGGAVNILLLQDLYTVPNIWKEFEALPEAVRPFVASIIAVPYLDSHGFSACLARIAGTDLLRPVVCNETNKPAAAQYVRNTAAKQFDLFLCHFQRTGLDWAFAMRLSFVQHAGAAFKTFLDVQSLSNVSECGRFIEQSHALAVLVTPGIFTRLFCQRELLAARRASVHVIFVQHMRSCIDIEAEVAQVRAIPEEFMGEHGGEYVRAGGCEKEFAKFQKEFFAHIWTNHFRPPVFAYIHELEELCVEEILQYLRKRRNRRTNAVKQLDHAARALLHFLKVAPEDRSEVRAGLAALANQAAAGNGDDFCGALVRINAMPTVAEALQRHGCSDSQVAYHAFRSLRCSAGTAAGADAVAQFAEAEGALPALLATLQEHLNKDDPRKNFLREGLEVLRVVHQGGPSVQRALSSAGLTSDFEAMFKRLRAEIEPLDEIREGLGLERIQLPELEFALRNWYMCKSDGATTEGSNLPDEVRQASELLRSVKDLRNAVAADDGEEADRVLQAHEAMVDRCAGVEGLLREARRAAKQFHAEIRRRELQAQTEEQFAAERKANQEQLENLVACAAGDPRPDLIRELEAAIILGTRSKCSAGALDSAHNTLTELRQIFDFPVVFLKEPVGLAHVNHTAAIRALLVAHGDDRAIVMRCLARTLDVLTRQEEGAGSNDGSNGVISLHRVDAESVRCAMDKYSQDWEVQSTACRCLGMFLRITREQHGAISARALVDQPTSDEYPAVRSAIVALEGARLTTPAPPHAVAASEAACVCVAELARLGEKVVREICCQGGVTQIWRLLSGLGEDGRRNHASLLLEAIKAIEEVGRYGGRHYGLKGVDVLLRLCDIFDCDCTLLVKALSSIDALFQEMPPRSSMLLSYNEQGCDTFVPDGSMLRGSAMNIDGSGLRVVLRCTHLHQSHATVQELCLRILGVTTQCVIDEGTAITPAVLHLFMSEVHYVALAMQAHLSATRACRASTKCLASLVDFSEETVCSKFVDDGGVPPLIQVMSMRSNDDEVQHCGLRVLSSLSRQFPQVVLRERSVQAIVTSMSLRPDDRMAQIFGCAAMRNLAEEGVEVAKAIGDAAARVIISVVDSFKGDMPLIAEAFRVLELVAIADPPLGRELGEACDVVGKVLEAIPTILAASPGGRRANVAKGGAASRGGEGSSLADTCLTACRTLRAFCAARAVSGVSFELQFHRGVCRSSAVLADLLTRFPESHSIQFEALQLIAEAIQPDNDGPMIVGPTLLRESEACGPRNLLLDALQRFHSDTDCITVFGLVYNLAVCPSFAATVAISKSLEQILRWTAIYRADANVQQKAVEAIGVIASCRTFEATDFLEQDGLEVLVLAAARHSGEPCVETAVRHAVLAVVDRCPLSKLHATVTTMLNRHATNAAVVSAICRVLRAVLETSADGKGHVDALRTSGAMAVMLRLGHKHKKERGVIADFSCFLDLVLPGGVEMHNMLLDGNVVDLLVDSIQSCIHGGSTARPPQRPGLAWVHAVTAASRRDARHVTDVQVVAAACRTLKGLLRADRWREIGNPVSLPLLLGLMSITDDQGLLEHVAGLVAGILGMVEAHVTWTTCVSNGWVHPQSTASDRNVFEVLRAACSAELLGFEQWRAGNFLPAAAQFRIVVRFHAVLKEGYRDEDASELVQKALERTDNLRRSIEFCEWHDKFVREATAMARTSIEVCPDVQAECPICLEPVADQMGHREAWRCWTCGNFVHNKCIEKWRKKKETCPMCRSSMSSESTEASFKAYHRARAVAVAADRAFRPGGAPETAQACLASAIASLYLAAVKVGEVFGIEDAVLAPDRRRAALFGEQGRSADELVKELEQFSTECDAQALRKSRANRNEFQLAADILQEASVDVLQRRCAALCEQVVEWEGQVNALRMHQRIADAGHLYQIMAVYVTQIVENSRDAALPEAAARQKHEELETQRREMWEAQLAGGAPDTSTGFTPARRPQVTLTPFMKCLSRSLHHSPMVVHTIAALCAAAATHRASRSAAEDVGAQGATVRRCAAACAHLTDAVLQDRLPTRVGMHLTDGVAAMARGNCNAYWRALLATAFFQQLIHCGPSARSAAFAQVDVAAEALGALSGTSGPKAEELRRCICALLHGLLFWGGSEHLMAHRLAREAGPRNASTLEEWFLDMLLAQHGATSYRQEVFQPNQAADAWLVYRYSQQS